MSPPRFQLADGSLVNPEGYDPADITELTDVDLAALALTAAKEAAWARVKAIRAAVQLGGCATPFGIVQTDLESRGLINGAVTMAMLALQTGVPFSIDFTLKDNSTVTLDASGMIALGQAVGQFIAKAHGMAIARRTAIEAAVTADEIEAVDINSGWWE